MNKIKLLVIAILHLVLFLAIGIPATIWSVRHYYIWSGMGVSFSAYLITAIPVYLLTFLFYLFFDRLNRIVCTILLSLFTLICGAGVLFGSFCLFFIPNIPDDGNEGFALLFSSIGLALFLPGLTSLILLYSRRVLDKVLKGEDFESSFEE